MNHLPNRRTVRLPGYDYSSGGAYFVTNCTLRRAHLFGEVVDGEMRLNAAGDIVCAAWDRTIALRREFVPHGFIVMPNHVHALFSLDPDARPDRRESPDAPHGLITGIPRRRPHSVATIMGGLKGDVTRTIRKLTGEPGAEYWQERFHKHIVRNGQEFETIARHIETNPANWPKDRYATE